MYLLVPIGMVAVLILYIAYLAVTKKNLRTNLKPVAGPALLFIAVWAVIYYYLLQ